MLSGVSKSGSPAPSPITSRPACLSARALSVTAMVGDGLMRFMVSDRKAIGISGFRRAVGTGRGRARQAEKPAFSMKTDDGRHHKYGPLGVCAPCSPHGGLSRHSAQRRLADACRARLWALAVLIASAGGLVYLVATSDGLIDYQGRPLGTDFSNVYAAGTYVLDGQPGRAVRSAAAARAREGDLRREDAVLRLALSAVLPLRRRRARADAVSAGADRLAGA